MFAVTVLVGHAPLREVDEWWGKVKHVLSNPRLLGMDIIWLVGLNGRLPADAIKGWVGSIADGPSTAPMFSNACKSIARGVVLADKLSEHCMWIPATFPDFAKSQNRVCLGTG